jgi:hypothetical protein
MEIICDSAEGAEIYLNNPQRESLGVGAVMVMDLPSAGCVKLSWEA